ncbi:MAG: HEAT repeat domain-containing protein [Fuerstiella sp.]|nr:HEAT repeat domain-containing protein [Fuerstiella sp.]
MTTVQRLIQDSFGDESSSSQLRGGCVRLALRCALVLNCCIGILSLSPLAWGQDRTPGADQFGKELPRLPVMQPAQSRDAIVMREGFRAELIASEPLVQDPVAVDFDEQGRMFVVQLPPYNAYVLEDIPAGSIALLEDTNDDGQYDRSTQFAENLSYPTAVACWNGGIFVGDAPDLLYLKDTNGDGKADIREVVFTGFGKDKAGEAHLNSIRWGMDNRFHLSTNLAGGDITAAGNDSPPVSVRGRGFVFDPRDRKSFELTSGGGQHGLSMDDWGRKFVCSNSVPAQTLMYDDRYIARNPVMQAPAAAVDVAPDGKFTKLFRITPPEPWRVLRTRLRKTGKFRGSDEGGTPFGFFTGATGITIYRGDAWPEEYRGNLFVGDVANNLVYRASLEARGQELVAHRADPGAEFLASKDIWFRPVQFANAPDGNLVMLDMCRELIEGAAFLPPEFFEHLDAASGNDRGRIYRILSTSRSPGRKSPQLHHATTSDLVALLDHSNGWHRDTASRLLYQRQDRTAIPSLLSMASEAVSAEGRATSLHVLHGLKALQETSVLAALDDPSADVRVQALRLAENFVAVSPAIRDRMTQMVGDAEETVRYQLAFSLGAFHGPSSIRALSQLAQTDGADKWMRLAILSSTGEGADSLFSLLSARKDIRSAKHGQLLMLALVQQISARGRTSEISVVLRSLETLATQDKALRDAVVKALLEKQSDKMRESILSVAGGKAAAVLANVLKQATAQALDVNASVSQRVEAIRSLRLGGLTDVKSVIEDLLQPAQPQQLQSAALDVVAAFDDDGVVRLLLDHWSGLSPSLRARAAETLLSRPSWVQALMDAVESGDVATADIDPARVQLLMKHPDARISSRVGKIFARTAVSARKDVVDRYQAALTADGDADRGKQVFKKNCSACHRLEDVGTAVGAELKGIRQRGLPSVLLNILDPNREVKPKFLSYVVATTDGRVLAGMISAENANSITLRRADGTTNVVLRIDIEEMSSTGLSFMPEGLEKTVTVQDMSDLLSYLNEID